MNFVHAFLILEGFVVALQQQLGAFVYVMAVSFGIADSFQILISLVQRRRGQYRPSDILAIPVFIIVGSDLREFRRFRYFLSLHFCKQRRWMSSHRQSQKYIYIKLFCASSKYFSLLVFLNNKVPLLSVYLGKHILCKPKYFYF